MSPIERVGALCLALPEAFERQTWDHPTFRVGTGRGKIFCTAAPDGSTITLKADPVEREALLDDGDPYFIPVYVGDKGWLGVGLDDAETDWEEVAELIATSYCLVAPKRLAQQVSSPPSLDCWLSTHVGEPAPFPALGERDRRSCCGSCVRRGTTTAMPEHPIVRLRAQRAEATVWGSGRLATVAPHARTSSKTVAPDLTADAPARA